MLQDVAIAEKFAIRHYLETGETALQMPTQKPRQTYIPLATTNSCYEYYTRISNKGIAAGLLSLDLEPLSTNYEMACAIRAATKRRALCSLSLQLLKQPSQKVSVK